MPETLDPSKAGPLLCGGITVFNPIVQFGVKPTDSVGVIGIGGLGHMALKFLRAWGCEVTAFTSSDSKREEALGFGAHHTLNSRHPRNSPRRRGASIPLKYRQCRSRLEFLYRRTEAKGHLHTVGAVPHRGSCCFSNDSWAEIFLRLPAG